MSGNNVVRSGGCGCSTLAILLTVTFTIAKIIGYLPDWGWLLVLSPFIIYISLVCSIFIAVMIILMTVAILKDM